MVTPIEILAFDENGAEIILRVTDALAADEDPALTPARLSGIVAAEMTEN